ncbi:MAG: DsbA family oxidoreductase [Alphaproteobacteria bacterium]|nr:DsbA family oxidoreductase [Alphaproteobacteria bacterium]
MTEADTNPTTVPIRIDVVSDVVCPWCYIGKRRLERALAEANLPSVEIGWRPFQLNPDMPRDGMDRREYLSEKFGGDGSGGTVYDAVRAAGDAEQIPFDFTRIERQPNTVKAHRLIHYAGEKGVQDAVVEGLFLAYFTAGQDIGETEPLVAVAVAAELDGDEVRAYLESDADVERIRSEDQVARQIGVQGVPCFIVNRKYAVSGAQDPGVFLQVFDTIAKTEEEAEPAAE